MIHGNLTKKKKKKPKLHLQPFAPLTSFQYLIFNADLCALNCIWDMFGNMVQNNIVSELRERKSFSKG